jgi:Tat protein translocase TatB subunit
MFGSLGGSEIVLILIIGLIVFGPRKLPEIGKSMGKMLAEFRKASADFKQTIENEVEAEKIRDLTLATAPAPAAAPAAHVEVVAEPAPAAVESAAEPAMAAPAAETEAAPAIELKKPEGETVSRG